MHSSEEDQQQDDATARVAAAAGELLEVLWGRALTGPVSPSQLRALFVLEHNDGINMRTLAEAMDSSPPSVSRLCDRLAAMGMIDRTPSATSRRELQLHLSSAGRALMAELRARRIVELRSVLDRMPARNRHALLRGLEAFQDAARDHLYETAARPEDTARTA